MAHDNRSPRGELDALRAALDNTGALIFSKNRQGHYTYANQRFCELVGASLEQVIGRTAGDFFEPEISCVLDANDKVILTTGRSLQQRETHFFKNNGARHRFLTVKTPIVGPTGSIVGLAAISIDITESEHLEQALREKQQLFDAILDNVDGYIYMKDREGRYTYVNRAGAALFQRTPKQLVGLQDADLLGPEILQKVRASDALVFATGQGYASEQWMLNADGQTRHFWSRKLLLQRPGQPDHLLGLASDITELKRIQAETARSEARFRMLFEGSRDAVLILRQCRIIEVNPAALDMLGIASQEMLRERHPWHISPACQPCGTRSEELAMKHLEDALRLGHLRFEWVLRRQDNGTDIPVDVVLSAMNLDGEPTLLATVRDLTDRKRYEEKIHQLAFYDALTSQPNRRLFFDRLAQAVAQSRRNGQHGAVIYLDLDNFKPVNDHHGHRAGDLLLQEVARRLGRNLREEDTVARLGGDEFAVLLVNVAADYDTTCAYTREVAERLCDSLAQPYVLALGPAGEPGRTVEHRCSASLGVALFPPEEEDIEGILKLADDAMYQAKESGRNQIHFATQ